ncbi:hypothetical protein GDO81_015636 [Engystomops pustulosus]|nr:hypothetical protein GDO81_015636 [Engystomops pustulosus]KAG8562298.1 hypothetical protein GDO81_015636 [Engystomops pustulosus]
MSLTGHTSPVESVRFSTSEKLIVAGSQSGSIRVWNMEEAKIQRTLMGHKANVSSLDFHPYGEFVASGSLDTNIKLWDVRRKGCVFRYKGHTQAVRCLRFSPDGKWLASSSDDHTVKLWDLSAGKLMAEFTEHTGPVQIVEFHPNEYLLASASGDRYIRVALKHSSFTILSVIRAGLLCRTVRFWDLEKFQSVGCMDGEVSPFRSILFSSDGGCLFCGGRDTLRVYGWEPERCFDTVSVAWGKVFDLSICNNQLIGVSSAQTNVSSFVVDLHRVKMTGSGSQGTLPKETPISQPNPAISSLRRNYERPSTTCTNPKRVSPTSDDEEKESRAEIQNPEDYKEIFQPKNAISRTPPRNSEPFPAPPEDDSTIIKEIAPVPEAVTPVAIPKKNSEQLQRPPVAASTPSVCLDPPASPALPNNPPVISAARNEPIGLKVADFLPVVKGSSPTEIVDEEAVCQIRKGHETMCMVLTSRMRNLDTVRAVWSTGDIKTSMDSAVAVNDLSVVVDLLNIINLKGSLWKLDLCLTVLPQIDKLLQSKYESYVQTGCVSLKLLLQRFLPLITDTLSAPPSVGVDISREERLMKCKLCYKQLKSLYGLVKSRASQSGRYGSAFRELQLLMSGLE